MMARPFESPVSASRCNRLAERSTMSTTDEGTRESLYQRLEPLVGRANAELLMRNVREGAAQFATRADVDVLGGVLRTEMAGLRGELKLEMADRRGEMADLRGEIRTGCARLRDGLPVARRTTI